MEAWQVLFASRHLSLLLLSWEMVHEQGFILKKLIFMWFLFRGPRFSTFGSVVLCLGNMPI